MAVITVERGRLGDVLTHDQKFDRACKLECSQITKECVRESDE